MKKLLNNNHISFFLFTFSLITVITILHVYIYKKEKKIYKRERQKDIYHNYNWYIKQKKYLDRADIIPINFESIESSKKKKKIRRNGWLYVKKNAPATILVCHGFMSSKDDMALIRYIFKDYNIMTFDFRAHGEDIYDQQCTLGRNERYDVIGATHFLKNHEETKNKPIFVYGFSMGSVSSILAQKEAKNNLFDGAIWDCPFDSSKDLIERIINKIKIELFGFNYSLPGLKIIKKYSYNPYVQSFLKKIMKTFTRSDATKIDTHLDHTSPQDAIKDVSIPMLLITCHNDDKAPPEAVIKIFKNAQKSPFKRLWIATGRRHFDAFFVNPEKYMYKLNNFIKKILEKNYIKKNKEKIKEDPCIYHYGNI